MLLRYEGTDADINIHTEEPEFAEWQWMAPELLISVAVPFKQDVYREIIDSFSAYLKTQ